MNRQKIETLWRLSIDERVILFWSTPFQPTSSSIEIPTYQYLSKYRLYPEAECYTKSIQAYSILIHYFFSFSQSTPFQASLIIENPSNSTSSHTSNSFRVLPPHYFIKPTRISHSNFPPQSLPKLNSINDSTSSTSSDLRWKWNELVIHLLFPSFKFIDCRISIVLNLLYNSKAKEVCCLLVLSLLTFWSFVWVYYRD
jgi:hypothetical protein